MKSLKYSDFKGSRTAIHCKEKSQWVEVNKIYGYKWSDNLWDINNYQSCLNIRWCGFDQVSYYREEAYTIIPASDFIAANSEGEGEPTFVREFDSNKYYWCKCENCGWEDSSDHCEGGHSIADTGDFSDPLCPICFSNKIEGEPEIQIPESYSGVVKVNIPNRIHFDAYKKTIEILNEQLDKIRYPPFPHQQKANK